MLFQQLGNRMISNKVKITVDPDAKVEWKTNKVDWKLFHGPTRYGDYEYNTGQMNLQSKLAKLAQNT